jgi:hypothetical protein
MGVAPRRAEHAGKETHDSRATFESRQGVSADSVRWPSKAVEGYGATALEGHRTAEINVSARRRFVGTLAGLATGLGLALLGLAGRVLPTRYVEATRSRLYPGPVKRLRSEDIRKPGRWRG